MKKYDIVIGLEIHAELNTNSKVFCSCKNEFGAEPNTRVCPVCLGLPGALPVLNKKAVESTIKAGLSLGCEINDIAVFERKNYFYPDLSKAYQISQMQKPICLYGGITLDSGKFIRLNRIHLEEDAGKLTHVSQVDGTYVDYNRGGVPLIEIVTEPDISSADEAVEFVTKLRQTLIYSGVANCKMEQGGFRCDVNLSVKEQDSVILGTRVEMKNLNSFKSIHRAIEYETHRQIEELNKGNIIKQQTRGWDDNKGRNYTMREKKDAKDYRYFPDPDLLTVVISRAEVERLKQELPESVETRKNRYLSLGLSEYDANILTSEKIISDYFDEVLNITDEPKETVNWIMTDVLRVYKETASIDNLNDIISSSKLAEIINLVLNKEISRNNSKVLFDEVVKTGKDITSLLKELELIGNVETEDIVKIIDDIIAENPKIIDDYKNEPGDITNYIVGNIMRLTGGKANVSKARMLISEKLNK